MLTVYETWIILRKNSEWIKKMDKFSKARAGGGGGVKSKWALGSKTVLPKKFDQKSFCRLLLFETSGPTLLI